MRRKWKFAFGVAAVNDILDLTPAGYIPVSGVVLDLVTNIALWPVLKTRRSLLTLVEYIPGVSFLPVYTVTVAYAYSQRTEKGKRDIPVE